MMKKRGLALVRRTLVVALSVAALVLASQAHADETSITVAPDGAVLAGGTIYLNVSLETDADALPSGTLAAKVSIGGQVTDVVLVPGEQVVEITAANLEAGDHELRLTTTDEGAAATTSIRAIPGWWSILPPLVAIGLALLFKEVLISLFVGIFFGALLLFHFDVAVAFARTIDTFVRQALADGDHASILIFSSLLGAMVGVISRSGGTQGIVAWLARFATTGRRGLLATWAMGVVIFFDDYANTLIVGSTMRPVTDRLKISREKLAYIVDSTAAPIACLAPISTWVGYEVGLIGDAFGAMSIDLNAYSTFLATIPYLFYPIFSLVLVFVIARTRRDFGPMLRAERRAFHEGAVLSEKDVPLADFDSDEMSPSDDMPLRAANALLPILAVIGVTVYGMYVTGAAAVDRAAASSFFSYLRDVFSEASSYTALLWGSLAGVLVAVLMSVLTPKIRIQQTMTALTAGLKSMLAALVVLVLAWSLGAVCAQLHTADFLVSITEGVVAPVWIPAIVFVLSAAIAFATGTSWATMAILMPLVIPIAHTLSLDAGFVAGDPAYRSLLYGAIASVLAGSVWGDHCSPISDTTILSSMASGCDHIAHVRTQIPYAMLAGLIGLGVGNIGTAVGVPVWITLPVGIVLVVVAARILGRQVETA